MIRFENLSKGFWVRGEYRSVLDNVTMELPADQSIALIGRNGAGKSTLLQILAGTMQPASGRVLRGGSVSWPVGNANSFHKDLTGVQNTRFLARAYGVDSDELVAFVRDFAAIGDHFGMPMRSYSSGMRSRVAFGVAMGIPFDVYLVDEVTAVGDARFKRKSREVFRARMQNATAILVSHSLGDMRNFCDSGLLLNEGKLEYYPDVNDAIARHEELMA
jgi:capsular polysaccharide transport system ATP-binding protein